MTHRTRKADSSNIRDMLGRTDALPLAQARRILDEHLVMPERPVEILSLGEVLNRVLCNDVVSPEDLPSAPRSTMDGYAVRASETFGATEGLPAYLEVHGEVLMGEQPKRGPGSGACYRIATGGYLPPGTDAVVMLEHTVPVDQNMVEVTHPVAPGGNVIAAGEDVRQGQTLLQSGQRLRPQDLALLAGLGISRVAVYPKVRVGILSTGDEIVPCEENPPPGKIRDMNAVHLAALCQQAGALPSLYGIIRDQENELLEAVGQALDREDVFVLSGGSSVGVRDLAEAVLGSFGPPGLLVHGVMVKPGKPVIVAFGRGKPLLGLPGHPVSAAVAFDLLVRPVLVTLSGESRSTFPERRMVQARLMRNLNSAAGRRDFVRVELKGSGTFWEAHPVLGKSGAVSTLVKAQGFIVIEELKQGLKEGETVEVYLY